MCLCLRNKRISLFELVKRVTRSRYRDIMVHNNRSKWNEDKVLKRESNWVADEKRNDKGFWSRKFVEFCERTDLHGYKYIVMNELNFAERFVF